MLRGWGNPWAVLRVPFDGYPPLHYARPRISHTYASSGLGASRGLHQPNVEMTLTAAQLSFPLDKQGIATQATIYANLGTAPLVEHAVRNGEGVLSKDGPFVVATGKHTGRSAKDKFIVRDSVTEDTIWWGKTNVPMTPEHFANLKADFLAALGQKDKLYVADLFGGSQVDHRVNVRVINEFAWHNLFIRAAAGPRASGAISGNRSSSLWISVPRSAAAPSPPAP